MIRRLLCAAVVAACAVSTHSGTARADAPCPPGQEDFKRHYLDSGLFRRGLQQTAQVPPSPVPVRGLIVPHHLEVADLIAAGLRRAEDEDPDRIIVLFPDHFFVSDHPFATTPRGFNTVMGHVPIDAQAVQHLLDTPDIIAESCLFGAEHGLRAVLPFLAEMFPEVPVVPLAISINSTRAEWDVMAAQLAPLLGPKALLIQATDFSHFLPHHEARLRDQQVLNLLAAGDLEGLAGLNQPGHVDSAGAMYLAVSLLRQRYGAVPLVLENRNLQQKTQRFLAETTSYVVAQFSAPGVDPGPLSLDHGPVYALGGDLFLGRSLPRLLSDDLVLDRVTDAALTATRGLPLILNLEGVLLPDMPADLPHLLLAMPGDLAVDVARRLNVVALGLANNHTSDLGPTGLAETRRALDAAGVTHFGADRPLRLPGLTIAALSDLDGAAVPPVDRLTPAELDEVVQPDASIPVLAYLHWGREFVTTPSPREAYLADQLRQRGVAAVVGMHPHRASQSLQAIGGGDTLVLHSLGNFLFDQQPPESNGALVEVRTFTQGTVFLRQLPLPDLFELARAVGR